MNIGFDISQTGSGKAGCGFYADAMIQAMINIAPENNYLLFPSFGDFFYDPAMQTRCFAHERNITYGPQHSSRSEASQFWRSPDLQCTLDHLELVHANNFWMPRQLATTRVVFTLYDLSFVEEPCWTTEVNRVGCFDGVFAAAIAADRIVAISQHTRDHFLRVFPFFPPDRIDVVYPCSRFVDSAIAREKASPVEGLDARRFWLSVGTIEPRKNQRRLLEAYALYIRAGGFRMPLVLAGGSGWLMEDFARVAAQLGLEDLIRVTGYVTDEELAWLYQNCFGHIYVSLFEGFGLPILEGMQFGAPSIVSRTTSMPEIADTAALLVDPAHTEEIAQAMLSLASDSVRRRELGQQAQQRAAHFDWKSSARHLLEIYHRTIREPKRLAQVPRPPVDGSRRGLNC
jgi:glycosyltransferase involved in cell wall biosynthesis